MSKIDNRHRIAVPHDLMLKVETDFNANLKLYIKAKTLFLDNPSPENYHIPCLGNISINKSRRFMIPQIARGIFNFVPGDEVIFYIYDGKLAFKRIFPEKKQSTKKE